MDLTRRRWLALAVASGVPLQARNARLRVGVMDGILRLASKPESVAKAAALGAAGIQVTLGRQAADGRLPLSDPAVQQQFGDASKRHKVPLASTYIDILHVDCLKSDAAAKRWVVEGIDITRRLNARILMLVFFGKCALTNQAEMDAVVGPLRELAPEARKAGVILGFENTISAGNDIRILDAVKSDSLQVYYDIGNATNMGGFQPAEEIRLLGRDRICQFHFKDKGYLGEGKVDVGAAVRAIADIGWEGYVMLETGAPSGDVDADVRRNLEYVRKATTR
jgi:sugar phosphate isomerase/epimerase